MENNTQSAEITNTVDTSVGIFPEDAKADAQTQATDGNKDQSQNTETPNDTIADQKETPKETEGDKKAEGENKDAAKKDDQKSEKAEIKLELSKDSSLTEDELKSVLDFAKEKGLDQEAAQKMLDMKEESVDRFRQGQTDMIEQRKINWLAELKSDKELGGDNFAQSVSESHRVVKQFFSEAFQKDLENSGLGNYKEFVRGFARIGKLVSDDKLIRGGIQTGGEKSLESYFYDDKKQ